MTRYDAANFAALLTIVLILALALMAFGGLEAGR